MTTRCQGDGSLDNTARSYADGGEANQTTGRLSGHAFRKADGSIVNYNTYVYDAAGNIAQINQVLDDNGSVRVLAQYAYDGQNQLMSETRYSYVGNDLTGTATTATYTYDTAGNLLSDGTITFQYNDNDWADLLTGVTVGNTTYPISYVGGNPTNWYNGSGTEYTDLYWEQGRRLSSVQYQDAEAQYEASYEYDMSGVRTKKNVDGEVHTYVTQNGRVVQESYGSIVLKFFYDAGGKPFALRYSNDAGATWTTMYYVLNAQGDVVKLVGAFTGSGYNTYASYEYDAWGRVLRATSTYTNVPKYAHIAEINPLRYRGYYYDTETGWYYLQSRYYDPIFKRFLNADSYASTGQGFLGYNMFVYCNNNPLTCIDSEGGYCTYNTLMTDSGNACDGYYAEHILLQQEQSGAKTFILGLSIRGAFGQSFSVSLGLAIDSDFNCDIVLSGGVGGGFPGASINAFFTETDAPSVNSLLGIGTQVGGSAGCPHSVGYDYELFVDKTSGKAYSGNSFSIGIWGAPIPVEWHGEASYTISIGRFLRRIIGTRREYE